MTPVETQMNRDGSTRKVKLSGHLGEHLVCFLWPLSPAFISDQLEFSFERLLLGSHSLFILFEYVKQSVSPATGGSRETTQTRVGLVARLRCFLS